MKQLSSICLLSSLLALLVALSTVPLPSTPLPLRVGSNNNSTSGSGHHDAGLPERRDVTTRLKGLFPEGSASVYPLDDFDWFTRPGAGLSDRLRGGLGFLFRGDGLAGYLRYIWLVLVRWGHTTTVFDARAQEAAEGLSKADFFEKYGFVILDAPTAMTASGWEESDRDLDASVSEYLSRHDDGGRFERRLESFRNAGTPVKEIYAKEAEELIRSVLPRATTVMPPAQGIRRKAVGGGLQKRPAAVVHNDYGLDFDEVVDRNPFFDFGKQRAIYEADGDAGEYMLVNLWRPIAPMPDGEPLRSMPLCFLDASTLGEDDFVSIDSGSLGVVTQLKRNPDHRFYYYPDMTTDEVVLFKQFHQHRNETRGRMPVFHTAFADPAASATTEDRVSFEYRVGLLLA